MDERAIAEDNVLFRCLSGSRAYGTSLPGSDLDIRGVFAAPRISVVTPFFGIDQVPFPGDEVLFELSKYVRLACEQNPNIIELLWTDPRNVLFEAPAWRHLKAARANLLTTKIRATFGGYANDELQRMRGHDRWLSKPLPEMPPAPADFVTIVHDVCLGIERNRPPPREGEWTAVACGQDLFLLLPGGRGSWCTDAGALRTFKSEQVPPDSDAKPAAIIRFDRRSYDARKRDHDNYWRWRSARNQVRSALEEKLGYDPKNGAHVIRLLRMAREALTDGVLRVRRPDAEELLAIRQGAWSLERILGVADELNASLAEAEARSPLPRSIDLSLVGGLVMRMYDEAWGAADARLGASSPTPGTPVGGPPDLRQRVVVIDVEGSGRATGTGRVVEIAAVEVVGGVRTGRSFHSYVDPGGPVGYHARQLHGLTSEFLQGKPGFGEAARGLLQFIADAPIVAHDAASDAAMLDDDFDLAGMPRIRRDRMRCTARMAAQIFGGTRLSLDALCDTLGTDRSVRARGHSALVDASLTADCLVRMSQLTRYGQIRHCGIPLVRRAEKTAGKAAARAQMTPASILVSEDRSLVTFERADGTTIVARTPTFPDTHRLVAHPSGILMVVEQGQGGTSAQPARPDNPLGPAVLVPLRDGVKGIWYSGGKPLPGKSERMDTGRAGDTRAASQELDAYPEPSLPGP